MTRESGTKPPATVVERDGRRAAWLGYGLVACAVWLGWQVVQAPFVERAPPSIALKLSPSSPEALRRAAEVEQAADRWENARALADESLARAPFNVRALRVRGLADAAAGRMDSADNILTLAGNWSLRDDPAHGWLVERRLRQGSYSSSFAHADTLARRRTDTRPTIFNLFTTAAVADPRATTALARLLVSVPPWRDEYIASLYDRDDGTQVLLAVAIALEPTTGRLRPYELERLYITWANAGRLPAIRFLRERINRPPSSQTLQNGDFSVPVDSQLLPFGWRMGAAPGLTVEIVEDGVRGDELATRVEYDGYGNSIPLQQMLLLSAGNYTLSGERRFEVQPVSSRLAWTVTCVESGRQLLVDATGEHTATTGKWEAFTKSFSVPEANCSAQWLRLEPRSADTRSNTIAWYDRLAIRNSVR